MAKGKLSLCVHFRTCSSRPAMRRPAEVLVYDSRTCSITASTVQLGARHIEKKSFLAVIAAVSTYSRTALKEPQSRVFVLCFIAIYI